MQLKNDNNADDAVDDYIRARYISANEAAWRIFGFNISQQSPSVARLSIHEEGMNRPQYCVGRSDAPTSQASSLLRYFICPSDPIFNDMLYTKYATDFITSRVPQPGSRGLEGVWWEEACTLPGVPPHIVRRRVRGEKVARIRPVRPGMGKVFYIRLLLLHHAARSFDKLRTIGGVLFETFQRAAQAAGLLEEEDEARLAMEDAIAEYKSPAQLRFLFTLLIVEGAPAVDLWDRFADSLALDYAGNTFQELPDRLLTNARKHALEDIENLLGEHGKTTTNFGLPAVKSHSAEIHADLEYFRPQSAELRHFTQSTISLMTTDQHSIYSILHTDIYGDPSPSSSHLHFLTGKAGRGKSFIIKALVAEARSMGEVVVVAGTTALSTSDIDGGRTAHSTFKLPVTDDNIGVTSSIESHSARADFLRHATFIVWDELPMANVAAFEAVDVLLRHVMDNDTPFGGKVVIGVGDFRQVAPVVKGGGPTACYLASILSSPHWQHFQLHQLTAPIRNASDPRFADFVDSIGEDISRKRINLHNFMHHSSNLDDVRSYLYPDAVLCDPHACVRRAFLTPLNVDVDQFNAEILERLPGPVCE